MRHLLRRVRVERSWCCRLLARGGPGPELCTRRGIQHGLQQLRAVLAGFCLSRWLGVCGVRSRLLCLGAGEHGMHSVQLRLNQHCPRPDGVRVVRRGLHCRRPGSDSLLTVRCKLLRQPHWAARVLSVPGGAVLRAWIGAVHGVTVHRRPGTCERPMRRLRAGIRLRRRHAVSCVRSGRERLAAGRNGVHLVSARDIQRRKRRCSVLSVPVWYLCSRRRFNGVQPVSYRHVRRRSGLDKLHVVPDWDIQRSHGAARMPSLSWCTHRRHVRVQHCCKHYFKLQLEHQFFDKQHRKLVRDSRVRRSCFDWSASGKLEHQRKQAGVQACSGADAERGSAAG